MTANESLTNSLLYNTPPGDNLPEQPLPHRNSDPVWGLCQDTLANSGSQLGPYSWGAMGATTTGPAVLRWPQFVTIDKDCLFGGESTLDLCYESLEEIPEWQRPCRRNLQCGDDSIFRAYVTRDSGSPCLGAMGPWSGGSALLVISFSLLVSILLCSSSMRGRPSAPGSWGR